MRGNPAKRKLRAGGSVSAININFAPGPAAFERDANENAIVGGSQGFLAAVKALD